MLREIIGMHRDEEGAWVAELRCGHPQHLRHDPPFENGPWLDSDEGLRSKLGATLDCAFCEMAVLPQGLAVTRRTAVMSELDMPDKLRVEHRTKGGVWARIVVEEGEVEYTCARGWFVLRPGIAGVVEPASPHHVQPIGSARFYVEFLERLPTA